MIEYLSLLKKTGVSLERLATLCRVVDQGGIAKAAGGDVSKLSLYSRQLKELEAALGVQLTVRVGRLATPAPAARRLAAIARDHFKALAGFAAQQSHLPLTVTIGASNTLLEWVILPRLPALHRTLGSRAKIRLLSYRSRDLVEAILDRRCDVGLVRSTAVGRGLKTRPFMQLGYALFAPEALARGKKAADILGNVPLATAVGGEFRRQLEAAATRLHIDLNIVLECPSFGLAARAVQRGTHAAILPEISSAAFEGHAVRRWALRFPVGPNRRILLAAHPHTDDKLVEAAARAFVVRTSSDPPSRARL